MGWSVAETHAASTSKQRNEKGEVTPSQDFTIEGLATLLTLSARPERILCHS